MGDTEQGAHWNWKHSDSNVTLAQSSLDVILRVRWRPSVDASRSFGFAEDIRFYVEAEEATVSRLMTEWRGDYREQLPDAIFKHSIAPPKYPELSQWWSVVPLHHEPVIFVESTGAKRASPNRCVFGKDMQMHPAISRSSESVEMQNELKERRPPCGTVDVLAKRRWTGNHGEHNHRQAIACVRVGSAR